MTDLFCRICDEGVIPQQLTDASTVRLYKEENIKLCDNYRGLSLLTIIIETIQNSRPLCSKANIINVGQEATGPDGIDVKNVANSIEVGPLYNNISNQHIQSLDKVRALPKILEIRVGRTYSKRWR